MLIFLKVERRINNSFIFSFFFKLKSNFFNFSEKYESDSIEKIKNKDQFDKIIKIKRLELIKVKQIYEELKVINSGFLLKEMDFKKKFKEKEIKISQLENKLLENSKENKSFSGNIKYKYDYLEQKVDKIN